MSRSCEVVLSGAGVVTHGGEGPSRLDADLDRSTEPAQEEVEPGVTVPVGRIGRLLRHHFRKRFERLSQLDAFSQYAVVAAGHALDDAAITVPDERFEETGVIVGTCFGCQESNLRFDQFELDVDRGPQGVRPVFFKSTVDNVPAGWISMGYQLRGANATYSSGPGAGAEAMLAAFWAVRQGRSRQVLAGGADRLVPMQLAAQYRSQERPEPYAAEGAAMVVLEAADAAGARGQVPRASCRAATSLATSDGGAISDWLREAGSAPEAPGLTSVVAFSRAAQAEVRQQLEQAGLDGPFIIESEITGEMYAAQAPMALISLAVRMARDSLATGLLCAAGEADDLFLFLLSRP